MEVGSVFSASIPRVSSKCYVINHLTGEGSGVGVTTECAPWGEAGFFP